VPVVSLPDWARYDALGVFERSNTVNAGLQERGVYFKEDWGISRRTN
jgi:hypothetical protein